MSGQPVAAEQGVPRHHRQALQARPGARDGGAHSCPEAEAWNEFKAEGRVIADKAACELKLQIGNALVQALDGELDLDTLSCNYCKQTCAEDARRQR